jgi:nucleoside-diphosphate-sugar epimerase
MTTLITGAGMIGSLAAARIVRERGERPVLFDVAFSLSNLAERVDVDEVDLVKGDVTDVAHLVETMRGHGVDRVIHTASFLTRDVMARPYAGVRVNLMGTLATLEAARLMNVRRVVFCSSTVVTMGRRSVEPDEPTVEDFTMRAVTEYPPSLYASMKLASEWLGHNYTDEYGVEVVTVRFGGVFGPWQGTPGGGPSKLLKALIECAHRGETYSIAADDLDRQGMDYTYSHDGAQGVVRAAYAPSLPNRVYNATMGRLYTIREIIELIEAAAGRPLSVEVLEQDSMTKYGNTTSAMDLSRSSADLGYKPEFPMELAVADYLSWLEAGASRGV